MLKENLRKAIKEKGLVIKEISSKSGVPKRTVDKWIEVDQISPRVYDLLSVAKILETTIEELIDGEAGTEYIHKIVRNDPRAINVPDRISDIVENLLILDEKEIKGIRANIEALAADKKGRETQDTGTDGPHG